MPKPRKRIPEFVTVQKALSVLEKICADTSPKHLVIVSRVMDIMERMERDLIKGHDAQRVRK